MNFSKKYFCVLVLLSMQFLHVGAASYEGISNDGYDGIAREAQQILELLHQLTKSEALEQTVCRRAVRIFGEDFDQERKLPSLMKKAFEDFRFAGYKDDEHLGFDIVEIEYNYHEIEFACQRAIREKSEKISFGDFKNFQKVVAAFHDRGRPILCAVLREFKPECTDAQLEKILAPVDRVIRALREWAERIPHESKEESEAARQAINQRRRVQKSWWKFWRK